MWKVNWCLKGIRLKKLFGKKKQLIVLTFFFPYESNVKIFLKLFINNCLNNPLKKKKKKLS